MSVIIPTYNRKKSFLKRAIESVQSQTYGNYEIIVVDDNQLNSNFRQETKYYMDQYKDDQSIIYIQNERNLGGALSRNKGVEQSTGDYITFLDDDDKYLEGKLEHQIRFMQETNCDFSFSDLMIMSEKDRLLDYRSFESIKEFSNENLLRFHLKNHITGTPTFMMKKECFLKIDGFEDVLVGQEYHLMLKAIISDLKIRYLPRCDVIAYKHTEEAISKGNNKIKGEKQLYNFKRKYFNLLHKNEIRFIKFRHYAVLSVAYFKNKSYFKSFIYFILIMLTTPLILKKEAIKVLRKRIKFKKSIYE